MLSGDMADISLSDVYFEHLKSLKLKDFPCGPGSWRSKYRWKSDSYGVSEKSDNPEDKADLLTHESLQNLMDSGTFAVDQSLTDDIMRLRMQALNSEEPFCEAIVYPKLLSLRLADKEITFVDKGLLKFKNLKKLILSANKIRSVEGCNLPAKLEVLELCGNEICSIKTLNNCCCSLIHLGVSYNKLDSIEQELIPSRWESLVSLDLSYNGISNLSETVLALKSLAKLRNLTLEGNPVWVASAYRGYIVDSLKDLMILDSKRISADEKHYYRGISKLRGFNPNIGVLHVAICSLTSIRPPPKEENDADPFPVKDYRYQILFEFMDDVTLLEDDKGQPTPDSSRNYSVAKQKLNLTEKGQGSATISVPECYWNSETIDVGYARSLVTTNLKSLKTFLNKDVDFKLNEICVLIGKEAEIEEEVTEASADGSEEGHGTKKTRTRKLPRVTLPSHIKEGKGKPRGKDKHEEQHFYEISRETKTIGKVAMKLPSSDNGKITIATDLTFEEVIPNGIPTISGQSVSVPYKSPAEAKKKGKEPNKSPRTRTATPGSGGAKSALPTKNAKGERGGKGRENKTKSIAEVPIETELLKKPAMTVEIEVIDWRTAKEVYHWMKSLPPDFCF